MAKYKTMLALALLLAMILAPVVAQDASEVTFMRFFGECADEFGETIDLSDAYGECGIIQTLANSFNATQDEVNVNTVVVDWPGVTELNANLAAGTPPDIMVLHGRRIPNYASRGLLTPLSDVLAGAGIAADDLTESARGFVEYNGELYGIPLDLHGHLWHINVGLWAEAGLVNADGGPMIPYGMDEFMSHAEQFKEATGLPFLGMWTNGLSRNWMALVYQQEGGAVEDEDGMPNVNNEAGLNALNFLMMLRDEGHITDNVDYPASEEIFLNGENGGHINGTWVVNFYDNQVADPDAPLKDYYVHNFPTIYDQPATWAGSHAWIIPQGSEPDPAKLDATLTFLKYLNDNNIEWSRTRHSAVNTSVVNSDVYNSYPHRNEYAEFVPSAVIPPRENWSTAFESVMDEELAAAFIGEKTPEQALSDAQTRLEDFALFE
ncbi:MAG: extracellular solute-binding protein [Chloroflexi bacterium]|nr:extracellular solute-binding protein [Chloroflexota bacterium]MCY4247530.1 extracellular solute-binding protein [Chloroflexota bacterium]